MASYRVLTKTHDDGTKILTEAIYRDQQPSGKDYLELLVHCEFSTEYIHTIRTALIRPGYDVPNDSIAQGWLKVPIPKGISTNLRPPTPPPGFTMDDYVRAKESDALHVRFYKLEAGTIIPSTLEVICNNESTGHASICFPNPLQVEPVSIKRRNNSLLAADVSPMIGELYAVKCVQNLPWEPYSLKGKPDLSYFDLYGILDGWKELEILTGKFCPYGLFSFSKSDCFTTPALEEMFGFRGVQNAKSAMLLMMFKYECLPWNIERAFIVTYKICSNSDIIIVTLVNTSVIGKFKLRAFLYRKPTAGPISGILSSLETYQLRNYHCLDRPRIDYKSFSWSNEYEAALAKCSRRSMQPLNVVDIGLESRKQLSRCTYLRILPCNHLPGDTVFECGESDLTLQSLRQALYSVAVDTTIVDHTTSVYWPPYEPFAWTKQLPGECEFDFIKRIKDELTRLQSIIRSRENEHEELLRNLRQHEPSTLAVVNNFFGWLFLSPPLLPTHEEFERQNAPKISEFQGFVTSMNALKPNCIDDSSVTIDCNPVSLVKAALEFQVLNILDRHLFYLEYRAGETNRQREFERNNEKADQLVSKYRKERVVESRSVPKHSRK